ncbi:hypothetical protein [Parabacteroides johnsonii]|uniref:hypothetical protein n=1 Tax=Parabacteroides johnsonii TaxID=387661 RepID=UPI001C8C5DDA|nr:hypothetical protein [Parabacteroides johnsonii]MBX9111730.1 hypothetical protein [Parabacteroides johnsonii]
MIGADINLPELSAGDIADMINTSTTIKLCSFKGNITGGKNVGGVAATLMLPVTILRIAMLMR